MRQGESYIIGVRLYSGSTYTVFEMFAKFLERKEYGRKYSDTCYYEFEIFYSQVQTSRHKRLTEAEIEYVIDDILELENFALKDVYKTQE